MARPDVQYAPLNGFRKAGRARGFEVAIVIRVSEKVCPACARREDNAIYIPPSDGPVYYGHLWRVAEVGERVALVEALCNPTAISTLWSLKGLRNRLVTRGLLNLAEAIDEERFAACLQNI